MVATGEAEAERTDSEPGGGRRRWWGRGVSEPRRDGVRLAQADPTGRRASEFEPSDEKQRAR